MRASHPSGPRQSGCAASHATRGALMLASSSRPGSCSDSRAWDGMAGRGLQPRSRRVAASSFVGLQLAAAPRRRSRAARRACCSATTYAARRDPTRAQELHRGSRPRRVRPLPRRDRAWSCRARPAHRSSPRQRCARQRALMSLLLLLRLLLRLRCRRPCPRRSATSRRPRPPTRAPDGQPVARTNPRRRADAEFACEPKANASSARSTQRDTPCALLATRARWPALLTRLCTAAAVARTAGLQRPTTDGQCSERCADRRAASATDARMAGRIVSARLSCQTSQLLQRAG